MRNRLPLAAVLCLLGTVPAAAQPVDATAFSLATLTTSTRAVALGGASTALPSANVLDFLDNPAHLQPEYHNHVGVALTNHLSSLRIGTAAMARDYGDLGTFGVGIRYLGWGAIDRADAGGVRDGTFGAGEFAFSVAASRPLDDRSRAGVTLEWLRSAIDGQAASAVALQLGVMRYDPDTRTGVSLAVHHLGFVLSSLGDTRDRLPFDLRLGVSKRLQYLPLLISVTAYDLTDYDDPTGDATFVTQLFHHLKLGGEFQFSDHFQVRFGYDRRRHDALKMKSRLDFAGFSLGTGLRIGRVSIDYAFNSWSSLGGLHQFAVTTRI